MYNEREIEEVLKYVAEKKNNEDIAVIVPYRYQVEKLRKRVPDWVKVDTIHKFQGRECDEIIFSTVANSSDDYVLKEERIQSFVNNEGLVNVAMDAVVLYKLAQIEKTYNKHRFPDEDIRSRFTEFYSFVKTDRAFDLLFVRNNLFSFLEEQIKTSYLSYMAEQESSNPLARTPCGGGASCCARTTR